MKLATICPPVGFSQLPYQSGYQMALAQYILVNPSYVMHMEQHSVRGAHIILDNGAAEGAALDIDDLVYAAFLVDADEVVLPDKLRDAEETLKMHTNMMVLNNIPPVKRMVVPQGKTWPEVRHFLKELVRTDDWFCYNSIGIPKHFEALKGGRARLLKMILKRGLEREHHIHLLGVYEKPFEEVLRAYEAYPFIRGIDTGAPIAYSQRGARMNDLLHYSLMWNLAPSEHARTNIVLYTTFCGKGLRNELESFRSKVQRLSPGQATIRALETAEII